MNIADDDSGDENEHNATTQQRLQDAIDKFDCKLAAREWDAASAKIVKHTFTVNPPGGDASATVEITTPARCHTHPDGKTSFHSFVRFGNMPFYDASLVNSSPDDYHACDVCTSSPDEGCAIVKGCDKGAEPNVMTVLCLSCLRCILGQNNEKKANVKHAQNVEGWLCSADEFRDSGRIVRMEKSKSMSDVVRAYLIEHPEDTVMNLCQVSESVSDVIKQRNDEAHGDYVMRKKLQDQKKKCEVAKKYRDVMRRKKNDRSK